MEGDLLYEVTQAFAQLGDPVYWIAVVVAVLVAGITGMIPGASGVIVMALFIPYIVQEFRGEQRAIGLVMLASMTGVNNTLDSIPAVLLGQPGAATQVTFLEGHQLARQGKAAHTLGAIYAVSAFGGLIGAIVLAMLIPVIKPVILSFGFAEIGAMAFFGIAMVSALSAGAMVKGLAAGALGVLFGTVGLAVLGEPRFVFQQLILWDRLPIIAVTLGFFALPEMIDLSIARRPVAPPDAVISNREVWRGARDGLKRWKIMIRQSVFGVLLGAIPGVGAAVIDWLSYAFGIFWSKDKSQFGKGSLDGVLFAESAQNSKEAGQAIPTLTLGVPGGLAWLFVLVAMIALDLTPGPQLLDAGADFVILLVLTLAIGNFIVTMLGLVATGQLAKLTRIPYPLVGGVIVPITFLTGVITMTSWLAIPIMLVFMGIGIIMKMFQWPRPPLLLGIILGPIIERNMLDAVGVWGAVGVATRPLTIALVVVAVATAYFFARSSRNKSPQPEKSVPAGASDTEPALSLGQRVWNIRNFPILLAVGGGLAFIAGTGGIPEWQSYFLPRAMATLVILLALIQFSFHLRERRRRHADIMDLGMHSIALPGAKQASILVAMAFLMVVLLSGTLGLRWAALAFAGYLPFSLMAGGGMSAARALLIGATTGVVIAAMLIGGVFAWLAGALLPTQAEHSAANWNDGIATGIIVALALALSLKLDAQGVMKVTRPGPVVVTAFTFALLAFVLGIAGWSESWLGWGVRVVPCLILLLLIFLMKVARPGAVMVTAFTYGLLASIFVFTGWPESWLGWVYRIAAGLAPLLLLSWEPVRGFHPSDAVLARFFSWRMLAPVITMSLVFIFEYIMADYILSILWPEPSFSEWIGREILVPLGLQSA